MHSYSLTRMNSRIPGFRRLLVKSGHNFKLRMYDLSKPLLNCLIAVATSRLRSLFAHAIISSSVITSSSSACYMIFLETIQPTSVDLSRNGRSRSSYRSKSTIYPSGWRSSEKVEVGQIVRSIIGALPREDRPERPLPDAGLRNTPSALNYLVLMGAILDCWSYFLQSVDDAIVSAEWKDLFI